MLKPSRVSASKRKDQRKAIISSRVGILQSMVFLSTHLSNNSAMPNALIISSNHFPSTSPTLETLLGLSSNNTFELFSCLGLVHYTKNGKWVVEINKLELYAGEHLLADFFVTKFNHRDYYIQIGTRNNKNVPALLDDSAPAPCMPKLPSCQS